MVVKELLGGLSYGVWHAGLESRIDGSNKKALVMAAILKPVAACPPCDVSRAALLCPPARTQYQPALARIRPRHPRQYVRSSVQY